MTQELKDTLTILHKDKSGSLDGLVRAEFITLVRDRFNYNPDMSCRKCIFKYVDKLYNDFK